MKQVVLFVSLAYALSWGTWLPILLTGGKVVVGEGWPTQMPGLLGPALAAVIVSWLMGKEARAALWQRCRSLPRGAMAWMITLSPHRCGSMAKPVSARALFGSTRIRCIANAGTDFDRKRLRRGAWLAWLPAATIAIQIWPTAGHAGSLANLVNLAPSPLRLLGQLPKHGFNHGNLRLGPGLIGRNAGSGERHARRRR